MLSGFFLDPTLGGLPPNHPSHERPWIEWNRLGPMVTWGCHGEREGNDGECNG